VIVFAPPAAPPGAPYAGYTDHYVPPQAPHIHTLPCTGRCPAPQRPTATPAAPFKVVGEQEEWITEW
jgi:hypothetical protein